MAIKIQDDFYIEYDVICGMLINFPPGIYHLAFSITNTLEIKTMDLKLTIIYGVIMVIYHETNVSQNGRPFVQSSNSKLVTCAWEILWFTPLTCQYNT